jgi:hypothetical protein
MAEKFENFYAAGVGGGAEPDTLYTVPNDKKAVMVSLQVANTDETTDATFTLTVFTGYDGVSITLGKNLSVPAGTAMDPLTGRIVLKQGDQIKIDALVNPGLLDVFGSMLLVDDADQPDPVTP